MNIEQITGLNADQVKQNQQKYGSNSLPNPDRKNILQIIADVVTEPMIFLLMAVVVVYFFLGDKTEAAVLLVSVAVIVGIELYQNNKTEKALDALRDLSSPSCHVIRDGKQVTIPSRELVPDDVIVLSEGERVPADAKLLSAENLTLDESLLTGESVPIAKDESTPDNKGDRIYSGSMVVKGHAIAEVIAIGAETEIGKIGTSLGTIKPEKTLLQKEIGRMVRIIAIFAVSMSALITVVFWLTRGDLLHGFLAGLTFSIAILPEEFPVVLAVFMALGAWRLAKNSVLTRKSTTIETLGSATVLCTDKTGTLTQNHMTVQTVTDADGTIVAPDSETYRAVVAQGTLASQMKPFDPMEEAFIEAATESFKSLDSIYQSATIIREYPLEESSLSVVHVWGDKASHLQSAVALKGAPEAVFKLCKLDTATQTELQSTVAKFARDGLRVLGVARGTTRKDIPESREAFDYEFLGLVALADPIREEAAPAVKLCRDAGIRVIMITGDYAETARRIGRDIGLDAENVMTGEEFADLSEAEQRQAVMSTNIFSRVIPAQKLMIVNALKADGEVVAMTGDGVNDAPALKAAHIGIAMGQRGTDVAREASSIVLLDDNFASIVQGIRTGRRIFGNLQKAMAYIITVHIPIAAMSLAPVLFGWELVLLPIHIVFLEFVIDPSCTLIFEGESEEPGTMKRPPRRLNQPLFSRGVLLRSLATGGLISALAIGGHAIMQSMNFAEDKARALSFLIIVLANVFLILTISGKRAFIESFMKGRLTAMTGVLGVVTIALAAIYLIPPIRDLFKFEAISLVEFGAVAIIAFLAALLVVPLHKIKVFDD